MKTVNIKGKEYVEVSQRILFLADEYKGKYSIVTSYDFIESRNMWIVKATLTIIGENNELTYTGHAQEIIDDGYINKTSALENCETSAVGRACAMAGIGIVDGIASVDEINKAKNRQAQQQPATGIPEEAVKQKEEMIIEFEVIYDMLVEKGWTPDTTQIEFRSSVKKQRYNALAKAIDKLREIKKGIEGDIK